MGVGVGAAAGLRVALVVEVIVGVGLDVAVRVHLTRAAKIQIALSACAGPLAKHGYEAFDLRLFTICWYNSTSRP